jgi:hypothetical protein
VKTHHAPNDCPVCGDRLVLTRVGCESCGTELSGRFEPCDFCALSADDRTLLRVFLVARGNMKELERHLGVSYPTARARYDGLLARLGLRAEPDPAAGAAEPGAGPAGGTGGNGGTGGTGGDAARLDVLRRLADGQLDVDQALAHLR